VICTYRGHRRVTNRARWRVLPSRRYRALLSLYWDGDDPKDIRFRAVPIYDGETGRLHKEAWNFRDLRYATRYDGWVQESWPRALADLCPNLVKDLPEGMAINEKQTAQRLEELRGQDPEAPVRRFPGWENAGLGGGGSRQDLVAFLEARDAGTAAAGARGRPQVPAPALLFTHPPLLPDEGEDVQ